MKKLEHIQKSLGRHWVGDGFPVRTIFTYNDLAPKISPFLLMDYGGPTEFTSTDHIRGVDEHPHRGFETVTIVYNGEVEHRDSAGGGGLIKAGDVQWMTAASGLVHEEKHSEAFAKAGGPFEMVQLWINLPKKNKMDKPKYQGIKVETTPTVPLEKNTGTLRIIAGDYAGQRGPAKTFSEINMWDVRLNKNGTAKFEVTAGHTCTFFVLSGKVKLGSGQNVNEAELAVLDTSGSYFVIDAVEESKILVLTGEPLNEPIVGQGPFVMNTEDEIRQAFADYQKGKMGQIGAIQGSEN